jgi:hypothetical protein
MSAQAAYVECQPPWSVLIGLNSGLCPKVTLTKVPMSEHSIHLRDQADKCRWHADRIMDSETKDRLLKLAAEYIERAALIDNTETKRKE